MNGINTVYLYAGNETFQMPARKFKKLVSELRAGRGMAEIMQLIDCGYEEFLAADGERYCVCMSVMTLDRLGVA